MQKKQSPGCVEVGQLRELDYSVASEWGAQWPELPSKFIRAKTR